MLESGSLLAVVLVGEETSPSIWNCSVLPWEWEERRVAIMFRLSLSWRCKRIQGRTGGWAGRSPVPVLMASAIFVLSHLQLICH